ncbi:MAG: diguanylate cyclase response regulator [Planctomycetales bacterium]|nr:diguanylate cyclase response regulator [Planctomycetales bacterium]
MATPLRALLIEDSEDDAFLVARMLERTGREVRFERIETPEALEAALSAGPWDLVVSDHSLPRMRTAEALRRVTERLPGVPFFVVAGAIRKEELDELLAAGARAFVPKTRLDRLPEVVGRAVPPPRPEPAMTEEAATIRRWTREAARASVRLWQLTNLLRSARLATGAASGGGPLAECLRRVSEILADPQGLGWEKVEILLVEGDALVAAGRGGPGSRMPLGSDDPLARAAREGEPADTAAGLLVPLRARGAAVGLLAVSFVGADRPLTDRSETLRDAQRDLARTLADHLALLVDSARVHDRLEREATTDALTGLLNRRALGERLRDEVRRSRRYRRPLSVLVVDVDGLKPVNDSLGHAGGDRVIREVAKILRRVRRSLDVVFRYGGDEFVVLCPETSGPWAVRLAERLRLRVEKARIPNPRDAGQSLSLTLSVGVASFGPEDASPAALLRRADAACYAAKRAGRNRVAGG